MGQNTEKLILCPVGFAEAGLDTPLRLQFCLEHFFVDPLRGDLTNGFGQAERERGNRHRKDQTGADHHKNDRFSIAGIAAVMASTDETLTVCAAARGMKSLLLFC
jgi:hypothetical protein